MLAHGARVAVHRWRHDIDPLRVAIERRRREIGRERQHSAQILGRFDHVDPFVVGDGHEVVLDEVAAGTQHRVPIGIEGAGEGGWLVRLDAGKNLGLGGVRIDLLRGRRTGRAFLGKALPAEREDRIGIEPIEVA